MSEKHKVISPEGLPREAMKGLSQHLETLAGKTIHVLTRRTGAVDREEFVQGVAGELAIERANARGLLIFVTQSDNVANGPFSQFSGGASLSAPRRRKPGAS